MRLSFEKWEGLGNDFVLVRDREAGLAIGSDLVRRICDRRHGVGADGVLVVGDSPAEMVVLNADGSRPEMCGNGLRCVAALLAGGSAKDIAVKTDAGERVARVSWTGPDEALVEVEMGRAEIGPVSRQAWGGREITFGAVSVGNPHAITFDAVAGDEREGLGRHVERTTPGGTNVEFARQTAPDGFEVVVWERGVGFTQACGTGACATAALACVSGAASYGVPVRVALPGGELAIHVSASLEIVMLGPARRVFRGNLEV